MPPRETLQDKLRARARRGTPQLQPLLLPPPADEEYWDRLSDILQVRISAPRCPAPAPSPYAAWPSAAASVWSSTPPGALVAGAGAGRHRDGGQEDDWPAAAS
jgi:hypothetical protein